MTSYNAANERMKRQYFAYLAEAHLIEPTHSERFVAVLQKHYPTWREARAELNELPLAAEVWR